MSQITLTASMRSNLLSLQQISKQQDQTQLRLASGLKVNSALDNPSSYYTAQSLSNRANGAVVTTADELRAASNVFIKSQSQGMFFESNATANISGNLYIDSVSYAIYNNACSKATTTKIHASAQIYIANTNNYFANLKDYGQGRIS